MAFRAADRVFETTVSTGTGKITLAGAVTGYQAFSAIPSIATNDIVPYVIEKPSVAEWEVGFGTYTSTGTTLARTTVLASSNGGAAVSFSSGTKNVFCAPSALKTLTIDSTGTVYPQSAVTFAKQYVSAKYALTDGATIALDWTNGNVQTVTLGGNRTFTFASPIAGGRYVIVLLQDGTGSRTITWPTIKWAGGTAPVLTTTANKKDVITIIYDGTDYIGSSVLNA